MFSLYSSRFRGWLGCSTPLLLCAPLLVSSAYACGPDFSPILILDRQHSLGYLPEGNYYHQLTKILPPKQYAFSVVETGFWMDDKYPVEKMELEGLSEKDAALVTAMRAETDPEIAFALGQDLPAAIRLYTAGAIAYRHVFAEDRNNESEFTESAVVADVVTDESKNAALAYAQEKFRAVLALPEAEQATRAVWAAYMLAKIADHQANLEDASRYFVMTRTLAAKDYNDVIGLAVSSYGEEARVFYTTSRVDANAQINVWPDAQYFIEAFHLYAQQASYNSPSAFESLRILLKKTFANPSLLPSLMQDTLVKELIFSYAFANHLNEADRLVLIAQIEAQKIEDIPHQDVVAAMAYRAGRYDLAERFSDNSTTALAQWVRAKVALLNGDQQRALIAYTQAIKSFPTDEKWTHTFSEDDYDFSYGVPPHCLANTEMGLLQLTRSEYVQALQYLYTGAKEYWMDAAYVAERIVTTDELKQFVEQQVPVLTAEELKSLEEHYEFSPVKSLRNLLARRLMRDKRYDEAITFFTRDEDKTQAITYRDQLTAAESGWRTNTFKAQALFNASLIAREFGMELFGYEGAPDYAVWGGSYEYGSPDILADSSIATTEKIRFEQSKAVPDKRFHYRFVAAKLASQSADLLPSRSQAFAAVLCKGTHYLLAHYPEDAQPIYQKYLKNGAYVPWGDSFGQECPEPEFTRAFLFYPQQYIQKVTRYF